MIWNLNKTAEDYPDVRTLQTLYHNFNKVPFPNNRYIWKEYSEFLTKEKMANTVHRVVYMSKIAGYVSDPDGMKIFVHMVQPAARPTNA